MLPDRGHARAIAVMELRRGVRKLREKNPVQLLALGFAGLVFAFVAVVAVGASYAGGRAYAQGELEELLEVVAFLPAGLFVLVAVLTAYLTAVQFGDIDQLDGYLTTIPHRDVVGGLLAAGFPRSAGIFVGPGLLAVLGFAAGARAPLLVVSGAAALLVVSFAAYTLGFAAGEFLRYLLGRSAFVSRHRTALGAVALLAYVGLLVSGTFDDLFAPAITLLRNSPVAWYADLALLPLGPASPLQAAVAAAAGVLAVVVGVLAAVRATGLVWYGDGAIEDGDDRQHAPARADASDAGTGVFGRVAGRRTAWVARKSWIRARRAPLKLVFVAYPLFVLVGPLQSAIAAGRPGPGLPALLALYGAWATGAAFTLNPLGDEGAVLPVTLTTPVTGGEFVRGLVLAGVAAGVPLCALVVAVTGAHSPLDPAGVVAATAASVLLGAAAPALAAGVGTEFPEFEASNVSRSRKVVQPSIWGFLAYSLVLLALASPAIALQVPVLADAAASALDVTEGVVRVLGLAVGVLLVGAAALLGYRHAVGVVDEYTL